MKLGLHLATSLMVCGLLTHSAIAAHSDHNGRSQTASGTAATKTKEAAGGDAIDLRITVNQGRSTSRGITPRIANGPKATGTFKFGLTHQNLQIHRQVSSAGSGPGPQRNAIGAVVGRDKTASTGIGAMPNTTSSTTGTFSAPSSGAPHELNARPGNANTSITNAGQGPSGNHASGALASPPANGPSIDGTGLIRPGSGAGAVGGAAKVAAGVLSGNSFRPKHL